MAKKTERTHFHLFVPGEPPSLTAWRKALAAKKLGLTRGAIRGPMLPFAVGALWEPNPHDGSFAAAFSFGTASEEEQRRIERAPGALVLSLPVDLHTARKHIAKFAKALAACGALAIRIEESKLGFPVRRWLEMVQGNDPWSLYRLAVVMLGGDDTAATCGMQVFSLPDASVELDARTDASAANALLGALNVYQVVEDPLILSGHTFSPDTETPKRVLRRWPDANYPPGHTCNNPFGTWRLGRSGSKGEPTAELAISFMPALVALLGAVEEQKGKPLTKKQVEAVVSNACCMTVGHEEARALERTRGYADLDPELAWEQWQLARRTV